MIRGANRQEIFHDDEEDNLRFLETLNKIKATSEIKVYPEGLLDNDFILRMFSEDKNTALERFKQFNELENDDSCLDDVVKERARLTDRQAARIPGGSPPVLYLKSKLKAEEPPLCFPKNLLTILPVVLYTTGSII
ncbi:MAG: hypothetical protein ACOYVD_17125 [Bacillota bacterium]